VNEKVSEKLEAWTSGIEKGLTADDGQPPPAGSFRFASLERGRESRNVADKISALRIGLACVP
jgi:hypothetical protein